MNWDIIKGNWSQLTGEVKSTWGKLTDDEIDQAAGEREKLSGLIQEKYGMLREDAEREIDAFVARHKSAA
ncbi:CsbD family protein [Roseobacter weihaiensis]|uniref:CsbD family protein n=1 Tax=Roseobacter weihaiensis TaxID=2763262 RepID=UPI001D0A0644|nr:CsbD family protein [Roseobacter sp. H9]